MSNQAVHLDAVSESNSTIWRSLWKLIDPVLVPLSVVVFFTSWEVAVRVFEVPIFLVPPPSRVFMSLVTMVSSGLLFQQFLITFTEALIGFSIAVSAAAILAMAITESRLAERLLYPYIIAFQSMPKVAIAPLIVIWLGYGMPSKVAVAALLPFFPMLVSFISGLRATDAGRLKLMTSMNATRWQTLRYVRIPYAMPFVFAGLEIGGLYAMMGAIVAEFVGASAGIGNWLIALNLNLDTATTFALLGTLSLYGITFQKTLAAARRRALFWAQQNEIKPGPMTGRSLGR